MLIEVGFSAEEAAEFIAHKAAMKAPLTERAWRDHLAESQKAGWLPLQAAEKVMAKSWKGFEAKYVAGERPKQSGGWANRQEALEASNRAVVDRLLAKEGRRPTSHHGLAEKNYTEGVNADGTLA